VILSSRFPLASNVRVFLPASALDTIFDECDSYAVDETGGRLIGTYSTTDGLLSINVAGIIEPGPAARRSNTSFFQDGEFQERVFRSVERDNPQIEHLGNWHTHHVNGFPHLSGGDVATYARTVNHGNHNTPFFYALLVTTKEAPRAGRRYRVKHYLFRRGEKNGYEIDSRNVDITTGTLIWPRTASTTEAAHERTVPAAPTQRAHDGVVLHEFYGRLRAFTSPKVGLYWRGPIELIDRSDVDVIVVEDLRNGAEPQYTIGLAQPREVLKAVAADIAQRRFPSARAAIVHAERACNRAIFVDSPGAAKT
jgi:hypothetical protein